jgi:hypothetical protein
VLAVAVTSAMAGVLPGASQARAESSPDAPTATRTDPGPAGPPVPAKLAATIAYAPCVPGGPTAQDGTVANNLRSQMNGRRLGRSLNAYNVSCARVITATARNRGLHPRAAVIAVTTAITESTLHNYTQAVDHDSLGLFQQRPSQGWGTPAQVTNPVYATNAFLNAMIRRYPNNAWMSGDIGTICQAVQRSAYPAAYRYEVHDAQLLVNTLWGRDLGVLDFYLSDSASSSVHTRTVIRYGNSPMVPIVGDWDGDGSDTVSAYDPASGRFYLSNNPGTGQAERAFMYGNPGASPLVGDWDGDGRDNIGVRMGIRFYLRMSPITSDVETTISVPYGDAGDEPISGDWDADGDDDIGIYRPSQFRFYLRTTAVTDPAEATRVVPYGNPYGTPLVGDWNGDGRDNIGVRMGNRFYFRTSETPSPIETTTSVAYGNGDGNEYPVIGDWNGDGTDTQGIVY